MPIERPLATSRAQDRMLARRQHMHRLVGFAGSGSRADTPTRRTRSLGRINLRGALSMQLADGCYRGYATPLVAVPSQTTEGPQFATLCGRLELAR